MEISDVMTPNVECISPTATLQEAAVRMEQLNVGALPVCDNDRLAGMVTDRDIIVRSVARGHDSKRQTVREAMTPHVIYCFADQDIREVCELMRGRQVRRLPVLDRNKRLVGIVSLGDLAISSDDELMCGSTLKGISEPLFST